MIKQVLTHISQIDVLPCVSLVVFMVFFSAIVLRAMRLTRGHTSYMGNLPLDSENKTTGDHS